MTLHTLLSLPSLALETSAKALRLLAYANELIATKVASPAAPKADDQDGRNDAPSLAPPPVIPSERRAATAASPSAADAEPLPRDIPTLAGLPAATLVRAVDTLSSAELADLYDYESKHRRRSTVLQAIEAALAPAASAGADDDLLDDVRVPDELVYSTQTPRR